MCVSSIIPQQSRTAAESLAGVNTRRDLLRPRVPLNDEGTTHRVSNSIWLSLSAYCFDLSLSLGNYWIFESLRNDIHGITLCFLLKLLVFAYAEKESAFNGRLIVPCGECGSQLQFEPLVSWNPDCWRQSYPRYSFPISMNNLLVFFYFNVIERFNFGWTVVVSLSRATPMNLWRLVGFAVVIVVAVKCSIQIQQGLRLTLPP